MEYKKKRAYNFSSNEKKLLLKLAFKYKGVLENKQSNAVNWMHKSRTWEKITYEYNTMTSGYLRASSCLKKKYENLKKAFRDSKKKKNVTGSGSHLKQYGPHSELEKELYEIMHLSGIFDNDTTIQDNYIDSVKIVEEEEEVEVKEEVEINEEVEVNEKVEVEEEETINPSKNKAVKRKYNCESSASHEFLFLNEKKIKIIAQQEQFLKNAILSANKEHKLKIAHLNEEHSLKIKLLKLQIELACKKLRLSDNIL